MATAFFELFHRANPATGGDGSPVRSARLPARLGPVLLVALILFLRRPDAWLHPQFFQDDGGVFFAQNYNHGWRAIFIPYAGYLHVVLRLVAWTAGLLPMTFQPAAYNFAAIGLCLVVVARLCRPTIRLPHKTLLAIAIFQVPRGTYAEILCNLTNVQWFLALVPVLMLVEDIAPTGWRAGWDLVQFALVGLSGPFVLMSIPLFAAKWIWVARSRWNALCLGIALVCGAVQGWFIHQQPALPVAAVSGDQWLRFLAWKPIGPLFFGNGFTAQYLAPGVALAALLGLVALLILLNRRQPAALWPTAVCVAFGGAVLLGTVSRFVRKPAVFLPVDDADRYFFLPRLMLIWCLLLHLRMQAGWRRWLLWAALAMSALAAAADFACHPLPDFHWAEQVATFERGETDTLRSFPGWQIFLDRPSLRGGVYADVLGETPVRIIPQENAGRVAIGAQSFLQLHSAAGALIFEVPAQGRAVAGRYAAAPGETGIVEFSVLYLPADHSGMQVLWSNRLDPAHVPADGGAHEFEVTLPPQAIGRFVLGFRPAIGEVPAGGCFADVRYR